MAFDTFGQQTFAPALTPSGERGAAAFRFHARAEAVLALAGTLGRLVSAFHKAGQSSRRDWRAVTLGMTTALSISPRQLTLDLAFAHCQRRRFLK
jgi:hypothetical protein